MRYRTVGNQLLAVVLIHSLLVGISGRCRLGLPFLSLNKKGSKEVSPRGVLTLPRETPFPLGYPPRPITAIAVEGFGVGGGGSKGRIATGASALAMTVEGRGEAAGARNGLPRAQAPSQ